MSDQSTQEGEFSEIFKGVEDLRRELGDEGGWNKGALGAIEANDQLADAKVTIKALEEELKIDELTKLLSRKKLFSELRKLNETAKPAVIMFLDIDNFKNINDEHGHLVGDQVLKTLGERIISNIGVKTEKDFVGKFGGEEIVAGLIGLADPKVAKERAEQIREEISSKPFIFEGGMEIPVTVSIGVAIRKPGEDVMAVVNRADKLMYRAKRAGKNQVVGEEPRGTEIKELSNA